MMSESEIRKAIMQLLRPWLASSSLIWDSNDLHVLDGLAWALTGQRPQHVDISKPENLCHYLNACGIPADIGQHGRVQIDDDWLKSHNVDLA